MYYYAIDFCVNIYACQTHTIDSMCEGIYMETCEHVCVRLHIHPNLHMYSLRVCVCVCVCACVCVCVREGGGGVCADD